MSDLAPSLRPKGERDLAMHEIRLAGRGGQGVLTAGELIGRAAVLDGRWAQSIPTFGPERRGAPSFSTLRLSDQEIRLKCSTAQPGVVLTLDSTIWRYADLFRGLRTPGALIFNTSLSPEDLWEQLATAPFPPRPAASGPTIYTIDATAIALELLNRPITNTAMIGAFVAATGLVEMESVAIALEERFGTRAKQNIDAVQAAAEGLKRLPN